ncbi:hypothetical protein BJV78DRAFT_124726 [Lactifluus subvellereus]|nr:hypothetical protein BJV78DRAFT_124726 [Lactifluus subvellereus]
MILCMPTSCNFTRPYIGMNHVRFGPPAQCTSNMGYHDPSLQVAGLGEQYVYRGNHASHHDPPPGTAKCARDLPITPGLSQLESCVPPGPVYLQERPNNGAIGCALPPPNIVGPCQVIPGPGIPAGSHEAEPPLWQGQGTDLA